jgi:fructokinase
VPPSVLCIGEVLFDYLADQIGSSYQKVTSWTPYPGGAPANVATALTKLGTPAGFIGCVGQDTNGTELTTLLRSLQVNLDDLQIHPTAPTRIVYVTRAENGERTFAGFGERDTITFSDAYLQAEQIPTQLFISAQVLVTGTLALAYPDSRAAIHRALELAKQQEITLFVDVNWRPMFWVNPETAWLEIDPVLQQADFIKLSDEEAVHFFQTEDPAVIATRYPKAQGILLTGGERGCRYWLQGATGQVPAFSVDAIDTTGAGDAFSAGFIHQLCQPSAQSIGDPQRAAAMIRYASAVGALTTLKPGAIAAQPTPQEIQAFLETH